MNLIHFLGPLIITLLNQAIAGYGDRTKDKMYDSIKGYGICFRRMNGTHQIGCSSPRSGSTGVIHYCENQDDLSFLLDNGRAGPYIPVIPTDLLTRETIRSSTASGIVSGLLVYKANRNLSEYSHERTCPNVGFGLPNTCDVDWNPAGTGLLYEDIPFPIFYIDEEDDIELVRKCFQKFNNFDFAKQSTRSLCSLQLNSFMFGTTSTETCIRRNNIVRKTNLNPPSFCEPLGDQNVWSSLFPLVKAPEFQVPVMNNRYVIIATRLDTTAFFDRTYGAINPVTGLITFLATAKLLKHSLSKDENYGKNVLFVIFNGETYDYIGSQRLLYDMTNGNFPIKKNKGALPVIKIEDIDLFIELSQLSQSDQIVAHYYKESSEIKKVYDSLNENKGAVNLLRSSGILPPASLHTFLKNNSDLAGLVLADHKTSYVNKFYNSIYDNSSNINFLYVNTTTAADIPAGSIQRYSVNISLMVAKTVYGYVTNNKMYIENETALNEVILLVNELYYCYLENADCKVHAAIHSAKLQNYVISMYVGVDTPRSQNPFTSLVGLTLGWLTADDIGKGNVSTCVNQPRNYAFRVMNMSSGINDINNTRCFRMTLNFTDAVSPAFIIDDYDWSSGQYSSWSESSWQDISMRVFLKPSASQEALTLSLGCIVFTVSLLLVYFIKNKSNVLFRTVSTVTLPTDC